MRESPPKINKPHKPVIYAQGGGNKAAFTSGFLKGLYERYGLRPNYFSCLKGASGGAVAISISHTGQNDKAKDHWVKDLNFSELIDFRKLLSGEKIFNITEVMRRTRERFHSLPSDFSAKPPLKLAITKLNGASDYVRVSRGNIFDVVVASAAIPGVIGPLPIGPSGPLALDGALSSMIPEEEIRECEKSPNHHLFLLNTRARGELLDNQYTLQAILAIRPNLHKAFRRRVKIYNKLIVRAEALPNVHIFSPSKKMLGSMLDVPEVVKRRFEEGEYLASGSEGGRFMETLDRCASNKNKVL